MWTKVQEEINHRTVSTHSVQPPTLPGKVLLYCSPSDPMVKERVGAAKINGSYYGANC